MLTGLAGSGKTDVLHQLAALGEQVIDLERLAGHRGSVFGGLPGKKQPSHQEFQCLVSNAWQAADPTRPLWIEDEGPFIGSVGLPEPLIEILARAPVVEMHATFPDRVIRLLETYGAIPREDLLRAMRMAEPRLGLDRTTKAVQAVEAGLLRLAVEIIVSYYDDAYHHRVSRCPRPIVTVHEPKREQASDLVCRLMRHFFAGSLLPH